MPAIFTVSPAETKRNRVPNWKNGKGSKGLGHGTSHIITGWIWIITEKNNTQTKIDQAINKKAKIHVSVYYSQSIAIKSMECKVH